MRFHIPVKVAAIGYSAWAAVVSSTVVLLGFYLINNAITELGLVAPDPRVWAWTTLGIMVAVSATAVVGAYGWWTHHHSE